MSRSTRYCYVERRFPDFKFVKPSIVQQCSISSLSQGAHSTQARVDYAADKKKQHRAWIAAHHIIALATRILTALRACRVRLMQTRRAVRHREIKIGRDHHPSKMFMFPSASRFSQRKTLAETQTPTATGGQRHGRVEQIARTVLVTRLVPDEASPRQLARFKVGHACLE